MPLFSRKKKKTTTLSFPCSLLFTELKLKEVVGTGRSGNTFSAYWMGRHVAARLMDLSVAGQKNLAKELFKEFRHEKEVAGALRHPNIVQFLGSASVPLRFCLVYEFMDGGTLSSVLRAKLMCSINFFRLTNDVARGMTYLHQNSIIHRDLKSSNVLLDGKGTAKISGFGHSCIMEWGHTADLTVETGSYKWMAPEIIRHEPYSRKADVYSFAIIMWQLLTKDIPYKRQTPMQTAIAVAEHRMRPALPRNTPSKVAELVEHCWNPDPTRRPDFSAIVKVLPFIKQSLSKTEFKKAGIMYTLDHDT
ncbi:putative protein kinase [Plasmopara halstedii]